MKIIFAQLWVHVEEFKREAEKLGCTIVKTGKRVIAVAEACIDRLVNVDNVVSVRPSFLGGMESQLAIFFRDSQRTVLSEESEHA